MNVKATFGWTTMRPLLATDLAVGLRALWLSHFSSLPLPDPRTSGQITRQATFLWS